MQLQCMINLYIDDIVIQSMRVLCNINKKYEWAAELWGSNNEGEITITDLLLSKQVVGRFDINQSISQETRNQYQRDTRFYHMMNNKIEYGKKLIGWVHSHSTMEAFLSETDRTQIRNYLKNDKSLELLLSFVVSTKRQKRNRLGKKVIIDRILRRTNNYIPSIEIKLWIDGLYENKSYFDYEIDLKKFKFYTKRKLHSTIPINLSNELEREYKDLVVIKKMKNTKNKKGIKIVKPAKNMKFEKDWGTEYL